MTNSDSDWSGLPGRDYSRNLDSGEINEITSSKRSRYYHPTETTPFPDWHEREPVEQPALFNVMDENLTIVPAPNPLPSVYRANPQSGVRRRAHPGGVLLVLLIILGGIVAFSTVAWLISEAIWVSWQ